MQVILVVSEQAHLVFLDLLKKDKNVIKYLNETEIDKLFNLDQHFVHVDHIFDRVFG